MARLFTYKGKSAEELQKMSMEDYMKIAKSRQRRAIKRMSADYKALIAKVEKARKSGQTKSIRTHIREAVILPSWIGLTFSVYNGKDFKDLPITPEVIGHRLGEFVYTTKNVQHSAPGIRATRGSKFLAVK
ncbi:MAG: 30S ribosomal protein S19 [Candidatus Micrarchaeota archaeon]|nr:30S ribosomal protein S19 [Candidatus Micrarchaeota archaeon]MDE1833983.1 30S ribosomal protein S19 [Candidatus Micrarchaeota archaeon]MDE1858966.1 30S ribosomal protein S19 [Candidatus Micrarchaeota archaeon]